MQAEHGMARMQELLSSYYGMQDKESEAESQRDIDSPGFSADVYVREMLARMGLNELLQRDHTLIKEIKELDTNMQMLVYENYNKFISATDTIRKMKTNVASMEHEVEKVVKSMDVITGKSESINVALAPHRSKVEKLIGVRRLLKRLEFIFDLPQRLNTAVKQEEYANATQYYLLARRILGRYEHITSFKAIQVESEKIVKHLEHLLSRRLLNPQLTSAQVCEAVSLLAKLEACTDQMKQQFLDWHQSYFEKLLARYKTSEKNQNDDSVLYCLKELNAEVLTQMANVFRVYKDHFMPELDAKARSGTGSRMSAALHDDAFAAFAKETFAVYLSVCNTQFRRSHHDFGSLSELQSLLAESGELFDDPDAFAGAEDQYFVLMWVLKHFVSEVRNIDAIIPHYRLVNGAVEIIESCVRYQIDLDFRKLRVDTLELLQKAHQRVNSPSRHNSGSSSTTGSFSGSSAQSLSVQLIAQDAASTFVDMMKQVLRQTEPLVQTGAAILKEMSRLFSDLVQNQFYSFLKWFNTTVFMYTEPKRAFQPSASRGEVEEDVEVAWLEQTPSFLLFLACVCRELSSDGISECIQVLIEGLPVDLSPQSRARNDPTSSFTGQEPSRKSIEVTHMIQVTRETSEEVMQHISKFYGNALCALVRKGFVQAPTWAASTEEPRSIQEMVVSAVESTLRFGKEIAIALGDEQSSFLSGNNSRTGSRDFRRRTSGLRSRGAGGGMQLDIERIFAKRIQIFATNAELTTDWFVKSMLKMVIKAYGEWVRDLELTKFALQQVQLDAEFLRSTTVYLVADSQELESLLSDLLSNARERAFEDELMEQSNVVAIVSSKSTQVLTRKV
ncbi:hypothetical protein Poli38472_006567 [Pythium oligandrum]|uniref:Vacuolar protein sorting-associated protein 51 homolog n=1 Tax=Pythium oligandrum TaxID=41045 RepID=A0A8K1C4V3_PYTOL|nr:hypothetical protein Poli38472_006567 [Pythium oligandrum]|eukprot:TMW56557.1 hypothetical protein Poli38472_006567 [Pythium oligandrum]